MNHVGLNVIFRVIALSALLSMSTGCAAFTIQGGGNVTARDGLRGHEIVHSSCWSEKAWTSRCQLKDPRANFVKVQYKTNYFYALVCVVTLGAYSPQDVEWWLEDVGARKNQVEGSTR